MISLTWLIPFLPLLGFILIGVLNKRLSANVAGGIASFTVFVSFIISCTLFANVKDSSVQEYVRLFDWINAGNLQIPFSFLIDRLSVTMLLVVTGVGFLIHIYSIGYMHHDADHSRFFSYLNLFVFFMLLLVMGSNYVVMFAGWEGVGLCSYLLIGFWFKNTEYNNAARKAFVMNRIGDAGFLLAVFLIYITFGSVNYHDVFLSAEQFPEGSIALTAITILLFIGAAGKSAQIPLYTWLPDAMAGPTPVSALIHAATMVTAGIYMIVRSNILYTLAPFSSEIVGVIGVATAVFAATIAVKQNDIKKVLAYSTVSQLGFMFAALGAGAYDTALFHVVTHAFFKALLFLGAGSVIHAMSNEQDITKMGGLKSKLPITHFTFLVGTIAIAGLPPFAGFFSKDEILAKVYEHNVLLFILLAATSLLTAIYMFRLYFLTFYGTFRGTEQQRIHLHESPPVMTLPLIVLAVLSAAGGFIGMPAVFGMPHAFSEFLAPVLSFRREVSHLSHAFEWTLIASSVLLIGIAIAMTYRYYVNRNIVPGPEQEARGMEKVLARKYYVDEMYAALITRPLDRLAAFSDKWVEKNFIDRMVNSAGTIINALGSSLKHIQHGNIGVYVFFMVISVILLLVLNLLR